jgi:ATP-binding cassette subfamily F protein 3
MIRIESVSKSYGPKVLLKEVTYHFPARSCVALVGPNGCGKSTLLHILTGELHADSGEILKPSKLKLGFLPQEPNPNPQPTVLLETLSGHKDLWALNRQMESLLKGLEKDPNEATLLKLERLQSEFALLGGGAWESRTKSLLLGLGFAPEKWDQPPQALSGGWRMRLELAKIFLWEPDFLILDEPTNHLDLPALAFVENTLKQFEGTTLFVSHDRELLNRLSTHTLHLNQRTLKEYKGNFDFFMESYALEQEQLASQLAQLQAKKQTLKRFVERFGAKATKAKQAASKAKQIERLLALEESIQVDDEASSIAFQLQIHHQSGKEVVKLKDLAVGYEKILSQNISLTVHRGQKIALIGQNGIGKSTILKTIVGQLPAIKGSIESGFQVDTSYFAQDQVDVFDVELSILDNVMRFAQSNISSTQVRSFLGSFLFKGDDVFKKFGVLSGGEKSRVGLCALFLQNSNFLVLDEPTNHLDMSSCEILTQALQDYEGTALFVSHDRSFINEVATHIWVLTPTGQQELFEGNLDDYVRLCALTGFPNILNLDIPKSPSSISQPTSTSKNDFLTSKNQKRDRQKLEKEYASIEKALHLKGESLKNLNALMEDSNHVSDYKKWGEWEIQQKNIQQEMAQLEESWMELAQKLEDLKE